MQAKSNTASGMPVCLWRNGIGSRSSSKERDAETGLDYFGARYFSGAQGRFTSSDPVLVTKSRLGDPQRWNLYAYGRNNPLLYVDLYGFDIITYNDSGNEIKKLRVKESRWHNFWVGDTYKLRTESGQAYSLDAPLKSLGQGQHYSVISSSQTTALMTGFVGQKAASPGNSVLTVSQVYAKSGQHAEWDFKRQLSGGPSVLYALPDGSAHASDYIGNMTWGYIMASYDQGRLWAHFGAGVKSWADRGDIPDFSYSWCISSACDDPIDFKAVNRGFDWYEQTHPDEHAFVK
jgi:RHS repeat-associated protein